ncbi:MAG: N-acetylglucosamine kinase [Thermomicrobiales bacterium]
MTTSFLLSIDGGQTSTRAMIASVDGTVLGTGTGNPTVHYLSEGGTEKNRISLHGAMLAALKNAGVDPGDIVAVGMGSTGVDPQGEEVSVIHQIIQEVVPTRNIQVTTDTYTNLMGASGGEPGIVVIAGGGAIGYGIDKNGRTAISNGFGYWLGDEGSAFWIGMQAIDLACRASDRRDEPTALEQIVLDHFGLKQMRKLPRIVYRAGFERQQISFLAPKVARTAHEGEAAAKSIFDRAAKELALTAAGILRQLYSPGDPADVYPTGGVFSETGLVRLPFETELAALWPEATVRKPRFPPAVGGLIVAARLFGTKLDQRFLRQLEISLTASGTSTGSADRPQGSSG